jgi:hypothetical protein
VAGSEAKAVALRAVLRGRAVTSLVTDSVVAAKLLAEEPPIHGKPPPCTAWSAALDALTCVRKSLRTVRHPFGPDSPCWLCGTRRHTHTHHMKAL